MQRKGGITMASPVTEQLAQALPLLAVGAGQTLAISLLAILFATLGGVGYGVLAQQGKADSGSAAGLSGAVSGGARAGLALPLLLRAADLSASISRPSGAPCWCWPCGAERGGEVVRGGLNPSPAVSRRPGWRSGSRWQLYRHVLLPQALQRLTPPTINIYTRIIKTSSLAVLIGVVEVIKVGQQIIERTYGSLLIYGLLFLFFFWSAIRSRSPRAGWSNNGVMRYDTSA